MWYVRQDDYSHLSASCTTSTSTSCVYVVGVCLEVDTNHLREGPTDSETRVASPSHVRVSVTVYTCVRTCVVCVSWGVSGEAQGCLRVPGVDDLGLYRVKGSD